MPNQLDSPKIIGLSKDPNGTPLLTISWGYYKTEGRSIDPIVELFRPLRERIADEFDVHIVITSSGTADVVQPNGEVYRNYSFCYCPVKRGNVPIDQLTSEFETALKRLLIELDTLVRRWANSPLGMVRFFSLKNKASVRTFLVYSGYREPKTNEEFRARRLGRKLKKSIERSF